MQNMQEIMPIWSKPPHATQRYVILLFDRFSNHCLANLVEPWRGANALARRTVFDWRFATIDGAPVTSSSGLPVLPEGALAGLGGGDILFVMPSYGVRALASQACLRALLAARRRFACLAGLDTGAWLLAAAGLLRGYRATIHWDELGPFSEAFPDLELTRQRFVIDRDRITCGGAMAAFDLALHLIEGELGAALGLEVASLFMADQGDPLPPRPALGGHKSAPVIRATTLMRAHLEEPLTIAAIAAKTGLGMRALGAAFQAELGASPRRVYRRMRLNAARDLAERSRYSIAEIALRCGYKNASAMTRAFVAEFGHPPSHARHGARHGAVNNV